MYNLMNVSKADKLIKKPLSDTDIKRILGRATKLITYPDLAKYTDINQLLPAPNDFAVILIVEDETQDVISGHWTALLKYDNVFEFFDPYGNPPDYDLKITAEPKTHLQQSPLRENAERGEFLRTPHLPPLLRICEERERAS